MFVCGNCGASIEHDLSSNEIRCERCGYHSEIAIIVNVKSAEAMSTVPDGYYWLHGVDGWEPIKVEQDDNKTYIYMINDDCHLHPDDMNEGEFIYTPAITPPPNNNLQPTENRAVLFGHRL